MDEGRYVIVVVMGPEQTGKNHWAYSAPDPILCLNFDPVNQRGVAKKYLKPPLGPKTIYVEEFELPKGLVKTAALSAKAAEEQDRYRDTFMAACYDPSIRTIVMDREDEAWEVWRYSEFDDGKAKAHHYTPLNTDYKAMIKTAAKYKKNLVMLSNVKDEWKENKPTGRTTKEGFKHLGLMTEVVLESKRGPYDDFSLTVRDNRDDASRNGVILTPNVLGEQLGITAVDGGGNAIWWAEMDFANTMTYLIAGSSREEWV